MTLGELVVKLGVKADTFTVKDFTRAIGDIPLSVAGAIASMAGLSIGFIEMTKNVLDMTTGFKVFTAETGLNSRALQQWQMVAKQAGLSGDIVTNALTSLSSLMAQMRLGHGMPPAAAQALGMLGFKSSDLNLNAPDMLNKIQAGVSGKNPAMATELLRALGIDPAMMRVFETPAGVREQMSPIMSQGEITQMAEFQKELATFNQVVMREFVVALRDIEPYMSDLTVVLTKTIELFASAAGGVLGELHKAILAHRNGVGWFTGDATSFFENGKPHSHVTVHNNVTQNIHSTADPLAVADEAARLSREAHRKAAADLGNRGSR